MHVILAETVNAKFDTADLFFLLGMILLGIGTALVLVANVTQPPNAPPPVTRWSTFCAYLGLAFVALGLWVL